MNIKLLAKRIRQGEVILVTGAGFSMSLLDKYGSNLPSGNRLKDYMWPIAFPGEEEDNTDIKLVYAQALLNNKTKLEDLFKQCFEVDEKEIPDRYTQWYKLPWKKIYTFNIDDGPEQTILKDDSLQNRYKIINPLSDDSKYSGDKVQLIKLHGSIDSFPHVTFSDIDYAERSNSNFDAFYRDFAQDMLYEHVLLIGCSLNEPVLDHFMMGVQKEKNGPAIFKKSWAVAPSYDAGTKSKLARLNFDIIKSEEKKFFEDYLEEISFEEHENISKKQSFNITDISELVKNAPAGNEQFLKGMYPSWGDIRDGFAAEISTVELASRVSVESSSDKITLIRGYAGSGKTTLLMQIGIRLINQGYSVGWVPNNYEFSFITLKDEILKSNFDFLLIDDFDRFSTDGITLSEVSKKSKIIATVRSARSTQLYNHYDYKYFRMIELNQLLLEDAERLVQKLIQHNRLGNYLENLNSKNTHRNKITIQDAKSRLISKLSQDKKRELLSTMIEVNNAEKFEDFIDKECMELHENNKYSFEIYQLLALVSFIGNHSLTEKQIYACLSSDASYLSEYKKAFTQLVADKLIIQDSRNDSKPKNNPDPLYSFRHRVIAEKTIDFSRVNKALNSLLEKTIFWSYTNTNPASNYKDVPGKIFVRCINHDTLINLMDSEENIRRVYTDARDLLEKEFHYWLQYGNFESTFKNFEDALNAFGYATSYQPNDYILRTSKLHTEFMMIRDSFDTLSKRDRAIEIIYELGDSLDDERTFKKSPNNVTLLLEKGLELLKSNYLDIKQRTTLATYIYRQGLKGKNHFSNNPHIQNAWISLENYRRDNSNLFNTQIGIYSQSMNVRR